MFAPLPRPALGGLLLVALTLLPSVAAGAMISGADGRVWNEETVPATYEITTEDAGAEIIWELQDDDGVVVDANFGSSPLTVTFGDAPDGDFTLYAAQPGPGNPGRAARAFSVDTTPPAIDVERPVAGAVYQRGRLVVADYACDDAATCEGTVDDGSPIDTDAAGTKVFTVTATDAAGNTAEERVEYRVAGAAPPPPATPAGTPSPPAPTIRLAPPSPGAPEDTDTVPAVSNAGRLRPPPGADLTARRPVLRWTTVRRARLYNVQIYRVRGAQATKVMSRFPTGNRLRVPRGVLAFDERYVWRVWPLVGGSYPASPHGLSWFEVRRPVRLAAAQLLVNQRISQAALRRTAAISDWLDAGLAGGDLRDGGLGREDFGADVALSGEGTAIANGLAEPRPLVTASTPRTGSTRLRVSARQLLVNQRISQAAVRRADALAQRIEGGLTGGDLREGAVGTTKLAPGLGVASAQPAGPAPAASSTTIAAATRHRVGRVRLTDRQVLINQRIAQAAVRRANDIRSAIEGGLTGEHFRDGSITAVAIAPGLR